VLLRVRSCTICNQHDSKVFAGPHIEYPLEPGFPGHEASGEVISVGSGVTTIQVGDRVVTTGIGGPPLYREFLIRNADTVVPYTAEVPFEHASPLELFGCVYHAVMRAGRVKGQRVAVVGLGPAGLTCCQVLRACGAGEVIAVDLEQSRLDLALQMGATQTVDAHRFLDISNRMRIALSQDAKAVYPDVFAAIGENPIAPLVFECSGSAPSMETSLLLTGEEMVIFGHTLDPMTVWPAVWFERELTTRYAKMLSLDDLRAVAGFLDRGLIEPGKLITHQMPFSQYGDAIKKIRAKEAIKIALYWD
jgi:threonine dehydrogenase-like Zn-dependent dehydrogenase